MRESNFSRGERQFLTSSLKKFNSLEESLREAILMLEERFKNLDNDFLFQILELERNKRN